MVLPSVGQNTRLGTNEMYIGTATSVVRATSIKRKTEPERFVWDVLNAVVGVHPGNRLQEHSVKVMKYQHQGVPLQKVVASSHRQCSQQFAVVREDRNEW